MMIAAFTGCGSSSDGADNNADTSADKQMKVHQMRTQAVHLHLQEVLQWRSFGGAQGVIHGEKSWSNSNIRVYRFWFRNRVSNSRKRRYWRFIKSTYKMMKKANRC